MSPAMVRWCVISTWPQGSGSLAMFAAILRASLDVAKSWERRAIGGFVLSVITAPRLPWRALCQVAVGC